MKQVLSFDKLKLTNNQLDDNGHVSVERWRAAVRMRIKVDGQGWRDGCSVMCREDVDGMSVAE